MMNGEQAYEKADGRNKKGPHDNNAEVVSVSNNKAQSHDWKQKKQYWMRNNTDGKSSG
jgi:hypothetical protein